MKFISGILGGNKKNGDFFLELKEQPDEPMPNANSAPVAASNNGAKAAVAPVETVKVEEAPANEIKETKKKSIKSKKKAKAKADVVEEKAEEKAAPAPAENKVKEEPKEVNFATKYLIPKNDNMRRRPGANMNSFLDMASKVKTPMK